MTASSITKDIFITALVLMLTTGKVFPEETVYSPERYDVILDRSPFGSDPLLDADNPERQASLAAAAAAKELRLCFLLESQNGEVRAGFENLNAKPGDPRSVILMVGESFMGMKLLEIDLASSQATLEARGEPVIFELKKGKTPAGKPAPAAQPSPAKTPQRRFGGGFRRREPPAAPPQQPQPPPQPQPQPPQLSAEEEQLRREEVRRNLQEYQMEVIRQGMPPLPIPLTQEMDDQLVEEGVLPPMEAPE